MSQAAACDDLAYIVKFDSQNSGVQRYPISLFKINTELFFIE